MQPAEIAASSGNRASAAEKWSQQFLVEGSKNDTDGWLVSRSADLTSGLTLGAMEALFTHHTRRHHFYLKDLRTEEEWELGAPRNFPIGSCFKLAVLMAAFDVLDAAELNRPEVIEPGQFSIGVGVINLLDSAVTLTPHQMCQLMLTASDGTVTDWLIARIGLERIDAMVRAHAPDSHIACNLKDMVIDFWALPEAATCKQRDWSEAELDSFTHRTANFGSTHARDLAVLAQAAWNYRPQQGMEEMYRRCLGNRARILPRTAMHAPSRFFTKSGSLGRTFFFNDCGMVLDSQGIEIAAFGWCGIGLRSHGFASEALGGEIGVLILDLLNQDRAPSPDRTEFGTNMLGGL